MLKYSKSTIIKFNVKIFYIIYYNNIVIAKWCYYRFWYIHHFGLFKSVDVFYYCNC